jgi:hypothetical protein
VRSPGVMPMRQDFPIRFQQTSVKPNAKIAIATPIHSSVRIDQRYRAPRNATIQGDDEPKRDRREPDEAKHAAELFLRQKPAFWPVCL